MKSKRVGTFTLGIVLISFGVLFLSSVFGLKIDYNFVLSFWPVILILLGIEILIFYFYNKENQIKYDVGAILLLIITTFFTFAMAAAQFILTNFPQIIPMY